MLLLEKALRKQIKSSLEEFKNTAENEGHGVETCSELLVWQNLSYTLSVHTLSTKEIAIVVRGC